MLVVVVWFLVWIAQANREYSDSNPVRLGILLAWISLIIGAVLGIILGLYISNGEIPGLSDDVAGRVAEAHPPAMLIGYLLLAAFAAVEWSLHSDKESTRSATIQMWLLFVAGVVINIAFMAGLDEELAGPANLAMIVAVVMLLVRSRGELAPAGWRGAGIGAYARIATLSLVVALSLLTIIISWVIAGDFDVDALTPAQFGVGLSFDHVMFIGVMTNVLFGVLAARRGQNRPRHRRPGAAVGCERGHRRVRPRAHHDDAVAEADLDAGARAGIAARDRRLLHEAPRQGRTRLTTAPSESAVRRAPRRRTRAACDPGSGRRGPCGRRRARRSGRRGR